MSSHHRASTPHPTPPRSIPLAHLPNRTHHQIEELRKKKKARKPKPDVPSSSSSAAVESTPAPTPDAPPVESPDLDTPLPTPTPSAAAAHSRTASIHARRLSTSTGLRRPSVTGADILRSGAGSSPLSPTDLPDIYRKQATTISELTEAVERLEGEAELLKAEAKRLAQAAVQRDEALELLAGVKTELREAIDRAAAASTERAEREEETEKLVTPPPPSPPIHPSIDLI